MSIEVPIDELVSQLADPSCGWAFCYLLTVADDERPHLLALRPEVVAATAPDVADVLRFDAGGGRACRNASARPGVTLVFPPHAGSDGYSLVVDGDATVADTLVDVRPTWAVLHRPAP